MLFQRCVMADKYHSHEVANNDLNLDAKSEVFELFIRQKKWCKHFPAKSLINNIMLDKHNLFKFSEIWKKNLIT